MKNIKKEEIRLKTAEKSVSTGFRVVRASPEIWLKYTTNADRENSKVTLKAKLIKLAENINFVLKLTDFVLNFELLFTSFLKTDINPLSLRVPCVKLKLHNTKSF